MIKDFVGERSVAEVVKSVDSRKYCEKYLDHKCNDKWEHVDTEARNIFKYCSSSLLKCIAGFNMCGKRLKKMNKACAKA